MKKYKYCLIILACILKFVAGAQSATVMIDPATQESPLVGKMLNVDVKIEDITGLFGYQFDLAFDNTALKFSSIAEGEFLKTDEASTFAFIMLGGQMVNFQDITSDMVTNIDPPGVLTVVNTRHSTNTNIDGTGRLVTVTFEVLEAKDSVLELRDIVMANSEGQVIPVESEEGVVEATVGIKGDLNDDGQVRSNDAILVLRIVAGLIIPTDEQRLAADMNEDDKIKSNDAILILRKAAGLVAPSIFRSTVPVLAGTGRQITVMLAESHGVAGESITVPVKVDNTYGLAGGDISIYYDPKVLRAVNISSVPDLPLASNLRESGRIHIAFASIDGLISKTIAKIRFDVLTDDISPLTFKTVDIYNPDALPVSVRVINEEFSSWAIPPKHSQLLQNFPNPFNPETWIPYQLKDASEVTIRIYNTVGELVRKLDLGYRSAGTYISQDRAAHWDGKDKFGMDIASGVYFYSIQAGDLVAVKKLIVLK